MTHTYSHFSFGAIYRKMFAPKAIFPLTTFRIIFGSLMCVGTLRFTAKGWPDKLFIQADHFFKFYGFHWVEVPPPQWIYPIHYVMAAAALGIAIGFWYRFSAFVFAVLFTYVELWDATHYLNHYYLVVLLAWGMVFLPAHRFFSIDALLYKKIRSKTVSAYCIYAIIAQFCIVYFYAGVAKLNPDWLYRAMPLAIWLPERQHIPLLGYAFTFPWVAYAFSYFGAFYDLTIWAFLLWKRTRGYAYILVIIFHALTGILFNIGMFPYIMIGGTLIFFSGRWHARLYGASLPLNRPHTILDNSPKQRIIASILALYFFIQIALPLRSHLYSGNVFWHEQGYRFAWRVMAVEKAATARFFVENPKTGEKAEIQNSDYLTPFQEKQMAIQPDFILQFAHIIRDDFEERLGISPIVTADIHVALNRRASARLVSADTDLTQLKDSWAEKDWVLPMPVEKRK